MCVVDSSKRVTLCLLMLETGSVLTPGCVGCQGVQSKSSIHTETPQSGSYSSVGKWLAWPVMVTVCV